MAENFSTYIAKARARLQSGVTVQHAFTLDGGDVYCIFDPKRALYARTKSPAKALELYLQMASGKPLCTLK